MREKEQVCVHARLCGCACVCVCVCTCVCACMSMYVSACVRACMRACVRACELDYGPKCEHFLQRAAAACTYEHVCVSVFV